MSVKPRRTKCGHHADDDGAEELFDVFDVFDCESTKAAFARSINRRHIKNSKGGRYRARSLPHVAAQATPAWVMAASMGPGKPSGRSHASPP